MAAHRDIIITSTHRGLRYIDGVLDAVLEPGRYRAPKAPGRFSRRPVVQIVLVDVREQELTIKGQEILTSDKVALRVSILTNFKVVDPIAALERVANYSDRVYSDVQLAARRSLASMTLEDILTNRNQLSEDILRDVEAAATGYGVQILRADVKDIVFPGNLQDVMNRVLAAERLAKAQLVEARTKAEKDALEARAKAEADKIAAQARAEALEFAAQADANALRVRADAEVDALQRRAAAAAAYTEHPALLRLRELEAMIALAGNAQARIYVGFDKHTSGAVDLT
jgi:regulator of protease activity HflC (stomatin/prohibitin superfamily)